MGAAAITDGMIRGVQAREAEDPGFENEEDRQRAIEKAREVLEWERERDVAD